ncbi:MAG: hypothetical protein E7104_06695 [Prevotella sp.]|nr:hypothetical protein [Prevotella sp.]
MKRKIITVLIPFCIINSFAQTYTKIYTKGGQAINVSIRKNYEPDDIQRINEYYSSTFPNATFLDDASKEYNCHSYAWNISDGGSLKCWINQDFMGEPNLAKYWTDDYYSETTEQNAVKVFYYNKASDHSAIVSPTVAGMYESKWGAAPLMRHAPNYGPYPYMNQRKYYCHIVPYVVHGRVKGSDMTRINELISYSANIDYSKNIRMEYSVETTKGDDAVEAGRAIIDDTSWSGISVTFLTIGMYDIYLRFFNQFNELVGEYYGDVFVHD